MANLLKQAQSGRIRDQRGLSSPGRLGKDGSVSATQTVREASGSSGCRQATLQLLELDQVLSDLAGVKGRGSEQRRRELLSALMSRATEPEQQFLTGLLMGEIRQGALEGIMLDALAKASAVPIDRLRRAAMMGGGAPKIARALLENGEAGLAQYEIRLFQPVQPMLAQSAETVADALEEMGEAALEYKFDGARVQVA